MYYGVGNVFGDCQREKEVERWRAKEFEMCTAGSGVMHGDVSDRDRQLRRRVGVLGRKRGVMWDPGQRRSGRKKKRIVVCHVPGWERREREVKQPPKAKGWVRCGRPLPHRLFKWKFVAEWGDTSSPSWSLFFNLIIIF